MAKDLIQSFYGELPKYSYWSGCYFRGMASKRLHDAIPAFPQDLPIAPMHTISLTRLTPGETSTCQSILHVCQELGFFLLDLQGDEVGEIVIDEVDRLFRAGEDIMNLPEEVKEKF